MPAIDKFESHTSGLESPLRHALVVTPSDGADLPALSRALHVGTGGALRVTMADGETVTFAALGAGWHPIRVSRVHVTGTSATDIVACW